ncbi:phosphatidylinositol-specific phospholipase C1-like protein [Streptomyces sp. NBC_01304]|uniref:phosphatidylinositol-specific phospholipase C1-like protein n=1 Tax=Streptomyces sp. NBC_01304 TaxID=2903818 RepID=UPI002E100E9A|nr:phosphatidylinositol-specific phospholipase C1-like protein [Streptomyces sp. NBC_01304]
MRTTSETTSARSFGTVRRLAAAATALTAVAALALASSAAAEPAGRSAAGRDPAAGLRINQLQTMATHNSYHREVSFKEVQIQMQQDPGAATLQYSHASLPVQLERQRVRGIELDVFPDPQGGLYANPLIRKVAGLPALTDPDWKKPGFKVMHWGDFDYNTTCVTLAGCLRQVKQWSDAHGGPVTVPILMELKRTDPRLEELGGAKSPPWDAAMLQALDDEIRTVFGEKEMVTPDDIRHKGKTLEQSVLKHGWPRVSAARGQVMFLMDNSDPAFQAPYLAGGHESLQGRVLFTNSRAGRPDAAFIAENDPTGPRQAYIQDLVKRGYFVRTRSDVPLIQATSGDTSQLRDALSSGAQMISTDFPVPGLAARYGSDYVGELPHGATVRCNPVSGPAYCPRRLEP